jgi:hypothetical protein
VKAPYTDFRQTDRHPRATWAIPLARAISPCALAYECGIAIGLPQARLQIRRHFLRSAKVFGDIVTSSRGFALHALLEATSEEAWLGHQLRTSNDHRFIVGVP